ncbi:MAG: hypothetical protein DMF58_06435 [Acidobacteria bacterium]|nr:MAG: hypothetical protein DMF58_06435 [Acidobacteriota bacterium]
MRAFSTASLSAAIRDSLPVPMADEAGRRVVRSVSKMITPMTRAATARLTAGGRGKAIVSAP